MKGVGKFFAITIGGLLALMVLGMIFSAVFEVRPDEIKSVDLIGDWMWYRIGAYVAVIAAWKPICRFMTRNRNPVEQSDDEHEQFTRKRERDVQYLGAQWWKVALLLVVFEVVIIQQFGL